MLDLPLDWFLLPWSSAVSIALYITYRIGVSKIVHDLLPLSILLDQFLQPIYL